MQTKKEKQKKQHTHRWPTAASGKRVEEKQTRLDNLSYVTALRSRISHASRFWERTRILRVKDAGCGPVTDGKSIRGNPSAEIRRFPRMDFCTRVWILCICDRQIGTCTFLLTSERKPYFRSRPRIKVQKWWILTSSACAKVINATVDTKIHEFTSSNLNFVHYYFPRKPSAQLQNKSWKYFLLLPALVLGALLGQTQPKHAWHRCVALYESTPTQNMKTLDNTRACHSQHRLPGERKSWRYRKSHIPSMNVIRSLCV